jgi:hypothetical protein
MIVMHHKYDVYTIQIKACKKMQAFIAKYE